MLHELLQINQEVKEAMRRKTPIVALESTIIPRGMSYPENLHSAREIEGIIRTQGATPATVALYGGKIHIGMTPEIMDYFAQSEAIIKASRRNIAFVLNSKMAARTTVAATMFCVHLANLPLFVTGGIGGVHPQAGDNFDISADLIELSTTPVTVVCSGAKSILDLAKTLEVLETQGVAVIGYGCDEFPAFYSRSSGISIVNRLDTPEEVANLMSLQNKLQMKNGIVIANPIPIGAEISDEEIIPIIQQSHKDFKGNGQTLTPVIFKRIAELTEGRSIKAQIELLKNNALLGAKIAIAYQQKLFSKKS